MSPPIDTVLEIETPERLAFRTRIAGPARRMLAWMIDLVIRTILFLMLLVVPFSFAASGMSGLGTGLTFLAVFLLDWGYFFASELLTGGRSIGKLALKLRVVRPNGLPITWRESFLRNLLRAADIAFVPPYFVILGPLVMAFDDKLRRLGDLVAGTVVVLEEPAARARPSQVQADEALLSELPGALPLRREDLEAIELFVHRPHMSDARRDELAGIVAPVYAARLGRPAPRHPARFLAALWVRAQDPRRRTAP